MTLEQTGTIERPDIERTEGVGTAALVNRATPSTARTAQAENAAHEQKVALFADNELGEFRHSWQDVQASFVDDPRTAVRKADELVASLITRLANLFADERGKLEHEWDKGEDVSTEDLRLALRRYRSFFDRLLSV